MEEKALNLSVTDTVEVREGTQPQHEYYEAVMQLIEAGPTFIDRIGFGSVSPRGPTFNFIGLSSKAAA